MNSGSVSNNRVQAVKLFLLGFSILFLELILIRYLAGNIWNLGYFPNLVLLAVFVGMGMGFVFHHYIGPRLSAILFHAAVFLLLFLLVFVYFKHPAVPGFEQWSGEIGGELFFTATHPQTEKTNFIPLIISFLSIILVFALFSQRTAKLFRLFKPLTAYTLDIAGSCCGIMCFMLMSWFALPAVVWLTILAPVLIFVMGDRWRTRWIVIIPLAGIITIAWVQDQELLFDSRYNGKLDVSWSPYQKIELVYVFNKPHWIFVNGIKHQTILDESTLRKSFYFQPYIERAENPEFSPYRKALVIGSGCGNDVAAALLSGVEQIDAVEIDPVISKMGTKHNPFNVFNKDNVNLYVNDGRAFMSNTNEKYDLIIFALTDSLIKVSPMAQLRLENYLFTTESVERAFQMLTETGDVIFYNYYRKPWVAKKIQKMIFKAIGVAPEITEPEPGLAMLKAGKYLKPQTGSEQVDAPSEETYTPSDDWPFLYLKKPGIPAVYIKCMIGMALFVILLTTCLHIATRNKKDFVKGARSLPIKLAFLFMGIAFLLLETKSIVQFSLLFGTTWVNNSLVFLGVLLLVLAANWTAVYIKRKNVLWMIYVFLIISSLVTLLFPLAGLLRVENTFLRFLIASLMTFSPIYFANLIFSIAFRDQELPEHMFGWNLIGATIGGILEYSSMALGYNMLAVIVAVCYTIVVIMIYIDRDSLFSQHFSLARISHGESS